MPVWEKGGGRGRGERVRQRDVLPPRLGRTRAQGGGERQGGMGGRAAQAARADAAATGRSATRGRARERAKAVAGFGRRRRESAPGGERAERERAKTGERKNERARELSLGSHACNARARGVKMMGWEGRWAGGENGPQKSEGGKIDFFGGD
uniref:Epstein-Barr virus EBNA-1-like protein n=1 Tax=Oryza sativa subsp. japonica TaxID=39947 RepID=Q6YSE2_ORYSJ|nr:hypothetical protein [Oryza sativa Japonica Group]BAD32005.1 hypothetical protein [Oryza sativa Japonica Group]